MYCSDAAKHKLITRMYPNTYIDGPCYVVRETHLIHHM